MGLIAKSAEAWSEGIARRLSPKTAEVFARRIPAHRLREIADEQELDQTSGQSDKGSRTESTQ